MAVTLRELMAAAQDQLAGTADDPRSEAAAAVATFSPIARALRELYRARHADALALQRQPVEVDTLRDATAAATACWPHARGRAADLIGAAADAVATRSHQLDDRQRWAISVELAEAARLAVDTARRFPPYANVPHLTAVREAAVTCEQRAAQAPHAADPTALDRLVPGGRHSATGLTTIVDAAAALHLAARDRPPTRWRMAEVLLTINAANLATRHAAAYAARLLPACGALSSERAALAAPEAWETARVLCRPFDDATKLRPPSDSNIAAAAARLGRSLIDQLGAPPMLGIPRREDPPGNSEVAGSLLTVAALLPEVANRLRSVVHAFSYTRQLWAPERSLVAHEERNEVAIPTRIASPEYRDLERLIDTLRVAGTLTTALAADLATVAPARLPALTRAHVDHATATSGLGPMGMRAHDGARHAHLVAADEWAVPAPSTQPARAVPR